LSARLREGTAHRALGAAAAAILTAPVLAGCGDDSSTSSSGSYCGDLRSARDSFTGLLDNHITQDAFENLRDTLHTLRDEAPAALRDDWTTFTGAVDTFSAAMDKAGLTMDDMAKMGTGSMAGADMQTAMDAARSLGSAEVSTAQSAIAANARNACGVNLNS